jgi:adenylylsulfate kinase-like enzyme
VSARVSIFAAARHLTIAHLERKEIAAVFVSAPIYCCRDKEKRPIIRAAKFAQKHKRRMRLFV